MTNLKKSILQGIAYILVQLGCIAINIPFVLKGYTINIVATVIIVFLGICTIIVRIRHMANAKELDKLTTERERTRLTFNRSNK